MLAREAMTVTAEPAMLKQEAMALAQKATTVTRQGSLVKI